PPGWNKNGGFDRLDHDGAREREACRHPLAIVDGRVDDAALVKPDLALGFDRIRSAAGHGVTDRQWRRRADRGDPSADHLDRFAAIVVSVSMQVTLVERLCDLRERGGLDAAACNRHLELVRLTLVARADGAHDAPPLRHHCVPLDPRLHYPPERG